MVGKLIGYIRVSTFDQNVDRQLEGIKLDRVFIDKASGKDVKREQLSEMLSYVRDGDTIMVHSMDRLARNLEDLRRLVRELTDRDIKIHFVKESMIFSKEDSPMSKLLLSVMGAFAEFERALIKERQREGIAIAKQKGIYKGRKRSLDEANIAEIRERIIRGETKTNIARELGISRETLYQYLRS